MTEETTASSEAAAEAKAAADKAKAEAEAKKDPKDFILERKQKQLEKALADAEQLKEEMKVFKPSEENIDDKINKAVTNRLEINTTVSGFIKKYPSLAEQREKIEKYAHDPSRQGVPVMTRILEAVGADEFIKLGAKAEEEAKLDAEKSKMGGDSQMTETEKTAQQTKTEEYNKKFANLKFMKGAHKAYAENNS